MNHVHRGIRRLATIVAAVVALCAGVIAPTAAFAASGGTIYTGGSDSVNIRSGPGTGYSVIGGINVGTPVSVSCTANGTEVTGPYGATTVWDNIGGGRWVTDAYVYTGFADPIAMSCGGGGSAGPYRAGSVSIMWSQVAGCGFTSSGYMAIVGHILHNINDWWYVDQGCPGNGYYTLGTGGTPTVSDYAEWYAYPGAGARCSISMNIPYASNRTTVAQYYVQTSSTQLGAPTLNQSQAGGGWLSLGTYTTDGSGYLRVILVASSPAVNQKVAAGAAQFTCTSTF